MRTAAFAILAVWAVTALPVWLLGMGFAGEIKLLPDYVGPVQFWSMTAAMYVPPLLAAALLKFGSRKTATGNSHAED